MARFPRPEGTIENIDQLKVGDKIWHVCGIWPPFTGSEHHVVSVPVQFREHREYLGIFEDLADYLVFDVEWGGSDKFVAHQFASDGNLVPGSSHNDNYWCRSAEDAARVRAYLRAQWETNPNRIADELAQRAIWSALAEGYTEDEYYRDA